VHIYEYIYETERDLTSTIHSISGDVKKWDHLLECCQYNDKGVHKMFGRIEFMWSCW
jgi:hypothetical protein